MDIGNAVKYLYSQFILRDVLSNITPGAIVGLTAFSLFLPEPNLFLRIDTIFDYSRSIHWLLYIPIFGLFYVMGFAIECLERLFGIRLHKLDDSSFEERIKMFFGKLSDKADINEKWRENPIEFFWMSSDHDWAVQSYERLVVLKQMCTSNFGAILIAIFFLIVDTFCPFIYINIITISFFTLLLIVALYWGYRDYTIAVTTMEDKFRSLKTGRIESK